jgi:hypothetical protein
MSLFELERGKIASIASTSTSARRLLQLALRPRRTKVLRRKLEGH